MIKKFLTNIREMSKFIAEDSPKGFWGLLYPLYFFGILLVMLPLLPFASIFIIFKKNKISAFKNLETDLIAKWSTTSSEIALLELREWYKKLKDNPKLFNLRGVHFEPYGRFSFSDYCNVINLLYRWELQHHNYEEASAICDVHLNIYKDSKISKKSESFNYWTIQKAQIIKTLHGNTEAQKFLLEYVDPKNRECSITKFFQKLRTEENKAV